MPNDMKNKQNSSWLDGANASWLESLYEKYLADPDSIELEWRIQFETLIDKNTNGTNQKPFIKEQLHSVIQNNFKQAARKQKNWRTQHLGKNDCNDIDISYERKQVRILQLINSFRILGHFKANLNPLYSENATQIPELTLDYHQLNKDDLKLEFDTGSLNTDDRAPLEKILRILEHSYCHTIGAEYMHISETTEKRWIQQKLESVISLPSIHYKARQRILRRLTAAEGLEKYLHTRYVGQKRFSLEGAESLIPLLDELVQTSANYNIKETVIGMAHRGRLNVLINILGKTPSELFDEFEGKKENGDYMGDVKYHMGFSSNIVTPHSSMHLTLAFNPSHLEIVAPVVEGSVRARQERRFDQTGDQIIPIQIHGDAAFSGQGVVMETFQMSQSRGYSTKGTIHIVINNQIGFTTSNAEDVRSTQYCTEVSKMVNAPIFHVNGDDPEAVVFVAQMALDYRMKFKKDVVIDMICYRRHGHNEADEPSATQPMMYKIIKALPTTRDIYIQKMQDAAIFTFEETEQLKKEYRSLLEAGQVVAPNINSVTDKTQDFHWVKYAGNPLNPLVDTSVSLQKIKSLMDQLEQLPNEFERHARVEKIVSDRHKMTAGALPIDWGYAETAAYATLINDGYNIRLSGQDSGRGTFFHRHVVWHNQLKKESWVPLRNLEQDENTKNGNFLVIDSLLSEEAVLAFEYGYASTDPETLVIWEAQFGDFANNAQVVIDQFISAGEQKWQRLCGLVMLLPHGFEGQGAEHSSARLERYLQLCAQNNMQVCVPSTPAQVFHMMRRQMHQETRKPLICMSPKSLLRHKLAVSTLESLSSGIFENVIDDVDIKPKASPKDLKGITRIILCSGKVYYDLLDSKRQNDLSAIAIIRVEQLYPFPEKMLSKIICRYTNMQQIIWCQEEPQNQGAWYSIRHNLESVIKTVSLNNSTIHLSYAGRNESAAPAVGVARIHIAQQKLLVNQALGLKIP